MNKPITRYRITCYSDGTYEAYEDSEGPFIYYDDATALEAERDAAVEIKEAEQEIAKNKALEAEVQKLREAIRRFLGSASRGVINTDLLRAALAGTAAQKETK